MSKILITADIHFGLKGRLKDILWSMQTIREYAKNNNIDTIFVLGDLFHDRESLNIEVLASAYNFFEESLDEYCQEWIIFPGNHDMYMRNSWTVNTLKSLNRVATIIEDIKLVKIDNARFWILPFVHYESVYMKILRSIEEKAHKDDVLLTHIGVNNATLNECYLLKNWSVVDFTESKFNRVFAGHFHCHQKVGDNVWYPGSPIPFRFDEGMVPHGFIEYDIVTQDVEFIEIMGLDLIDGKPPDFITITDDMSDDNIDVSGDHVRIKLLEDHSSDWLARIQSKFKQKGALSTKFVKMSDDKIDLDETNSQSDLSLEDPKELFEKWISHDNPKKLNHDLLKKLNKTIIQ